MNPQQAIILYFVAFLMAATATYSWAEAPYAYDASHEALRSNK